MNTTQHDLPSGPAGTLPATRPEVVLAASMFVGVWLAWPWFAFNAFALGLEDKAQLAKRLMIGLAGSSALAIFAVSMLEPETFDASLLGLLFDDPEPDAFSFFPYVVIALVGWKSLTAYRLYEDQRLRAEVYEYFGGTLRNSAPLIVGGVMIRSWVLLQLLPVGWWTLVIA